VSTEVNFIQSLGAGRKWLAFGMGVGIEAGAKDLNVVVVRVRPSGVRIAGALTIHNFREQPAAEWGSVYANFLAKLGAGHLAAVVVMPRTEVTVRTMPLPGVAPKDREAALLFQVDSMHPYADEDPMWGWAPVAKTHMVLVGIARRETVDYYTTLCAEAGIKVAAFTFSGAVLYGASRLLSTPSEAGVLALNEQDGVTEAYGESLAHGVLSAVVPMPLERARGRALAELRLDPETSATTFPGLLPAPLAMPADVDLSRVALPYAAALTGACPWLAQPVNLLPSAFREANSRALFIPTAVLAGVVILLAAALGISGTLENRRYLSSLETQIHAAELQALRVQAMDKKIADTQGRIGMLDEFRQHSKEDMDALAELTKLLAPPAWLRSLDLSRAQLDITGDSDQAAAILKTLDHSPRFRNSEFAAPLTRQGNLEMFRIRSARKVGHP
jgi:Tfp pilus assembly protein PilN